ncbi:AF4/FMR2 family member 1, partial [Tauraco erythrolophus]
SLDNKDRNLLRIQEKERRSQEALKEDDKTPEKTPLFAEPYKTNKRDELSRRIQNMLGNYEEARGLISKMSHLIEVPRSVAPLIPQGKPDYPHFPKETSHTLLFSFHHTTHPPPMGPMVVAPPPPGHSIHHQKAQSRTEPASGLHTEGHSLPNGQNQSPEHNCDGQESHASSHHKGNDRHAAGEGHANELQDPLVLSPLLSSLSAPVAPLLPLQSSHSNSNSQKSSESHELTCSQTKSSQDLVTESEEESWDSSNDDLTITPPPSSPPFAPPLPSQNSAMQPKPTAYVRPMDGQDQTPVGSPELKPPQKEYHGELDEEISDLKADAKAKLSELEIPSEPVEETFPSDTRSVEDILKEITELWLPPLTDIDTPSTAEPSKFPFPTKESQHVGSVAQNQKECDAPSEARPSSPPVASMLPDDLQLSDSEESGDDQVVEKPPSSLASPSALQSQPKSAASAHSSSSKSGSSSDSGSSSSCSSSSSDSESTSSDKKDNNPQREKASAPEPDPPTVGGNNNKWQLDNWLTKVNPPAVPTDSLGQITHGDGHKEGKKQEQDISSNSSDQRTEPREPCHKSSGQADKTPQDAHLPTKSNSQKSSVCTKKASPKQAVGIKRPSKAPEHQGPKKALKLEKDPSSVEVRDQSSKDKLKVKTKGKPKSSDRKDPKLTLQETCENRKHKSSHQTSTKTVLDPKLVKDVLPGSAQDHLTLSPLPQGQDTTLTETSGHRPAIKTKEDVHKEKLPLPIKEKKLLSPEKKSPTPQSLKVKIDLSLLSRVPERPRKDSQQEKAETKELPDERKKELKRKTTDASDKSLQKRKREVEDEIDRKKMKSEKETKSLQSSANKDSDKLKALKASPETQEKDPLPPMSSAHSAPKSTKMAQKRPRSESDELPAMDNTAKIKSNHKDPLIPKHMKVERDDAEPLKGIKVGDVTNPFPVPSLPNGNSKPSIPQYKFEKKYPVEYYIQEAKKLKHTADAMTDKTGRAFQYLAAAVYYIEYGLALESDEQAPKSSFGIFCNTIELLKFTMTLKCFIDFSASPYEKILAVLCMRCQSLLYMAIFRHKKDCARKFARILNDYFRGVSRAMQAPSFYVARSTGLPSPYSSMPSPASSAGSQPGSNASYCSGNGIGSPITVPSDIPNIATSYIDVTSYVLYAYEIWEHADALAEQNKEFFAELSTVTCALTLTSRLTELIHYTKQGLQWLRPYSNMP